MTSFGRPRRHFRRTDSTNDRAREMAVAGAPSGSVVTAAEQTAGRGRRDRSWTAPAGKALLYSAILRPLGPEHALLPLAVPLAVCEAAEAVAPLACRVKWPNDVWVEGSKLAGILIEARPPDWAVIGIGLNVAIEPAEFPVDLRHPAVSIGHGVAVEGALSALNERLGHWAEAAPERVLDAFTARDALRGRRIAWEGAGGEHGAGTGKAAGVDGRGNLVVVTDAGERLHLGAGEARLAPVGPP
jgi:BirA family transcriptional regulator, biotin operon repressor / biotin---[acetyl-CoA-carboxylase] ligase